MNLVYIKVRKEVIYVSEGNREEKKRDPEKDKEREQVLKDSKSTRDASRERRHAENLGGEE